MIRTKAILDQSKCDKSPTCPSRKACPFGAITQEKKWFFKADYPVINHIKCTGCGRCVPACPHGAIILK